MSRCDKPLFKPLPIGGYETASGLQVEMYDRMEELKSLYSAYEKNMI